MKCFTHDTEVDGYSVTTTYAEIDGRMVRTLEQVSFPCGCVFDAASIETEEVADQDVTRDGTRLIQLRIVDLAGSPVLEWFESRNATEEF